MTIKKHIPNAITCCNLICGCLALVKVFDGNLVMASYLVVLGAIFDFFDGFAARLLKVSSPIGKDLDSLTDMVTFGVVPGVMMYQMVKQSLNLDKEGFGFFESFHYAIYFPLIIVVFSAIRLAKFNNDTRQTDSFIGVPTPAAGIFVCSIPLIVGWNLNFSFNDYRDFEFILNPFLLCLVSIVLSLLLVSEISLFALKFKHFKWSGNEIRFLFLAISVILLITLQFIAIPLIIMIYVLMSLVSNLLTKKRY